MNRQILFFSFLLIFSSCDPGYVVIPDNQSSTDKNIEVILDDANKLRYIDSISSMASSGTFEKWRIPVLKNINLHSYTFTLDRGRKAVLEQGIGNPEPDRKIIADRFDTILLRTDKSVVKEKHGFSTSVTILLR